MNFLRIAWRDIKSILKNRFIRVSVIAIIIVPLLYSLLYLAAFWDPYSKLKSVPVAVVNLDKGATKDGKDVNYGDDIVKKLKNNNELGWKFTTYKEADSGTKGEKYYAEYIIPENFSEKVISAKDKKPEQAKILYRDNEKRNFIMSQVNSKAELALKDEIARTITSEYTKVTFDNLYDVKDGFKAATSGSKKLRDGLSSAKTGSEQLKNGIGQVKDKMPQIQSGTKQLYDGANQLVDGINTNAVDKNGKPLGLQNGAQQLHNGLYEAAYGVTSAQGQISQAVAVLNGQKGIAALININNARALRSIMGNASSLSQVDLSGLNNVLPFMNSKNLSTINKTVADFNSINLNSILAIPKLAELTTPENINNINNLLNDTSTLSQVDMNKLYPIMKLMENTKQLNDLLNQAQALGKMDTSSLNSIKTLLNTKNAQVLSLMLRGASSSLGGQNGKNTIAFINQQSSSSENFVRSAAALSEAYNKLNSLQLSDEQKIQAQKELLDNYNKLVTDTAASMSASKGTMTNMANSLQSMNTLIDSNSEVINGAENALQSSNINSVNSMIGALEQTQESINSPETTQTIQTVQSAMSPSNIQYIQQLVGQFNTMKTDLDKNKDNLAAVKGLLAAVQSNGGAKDAIAKIAVLQDDMQQAQPIISTFNTMMNDPKIKAQLANAPQLLTQVTKVQKQLKDNQKLLDVAQDELNDGNIQMANNLIAQIPTMTGKFNELASGMNQLSSGSSDLLAGVKTLSNGSTKLRDGIGTLNSGIPALTDGANKLYSGSSDLNNGIGKLYDGSDELASKLQDGSDKINKNLVNTSSDMAKFVSEPLAMKDDPIGAVKNYGTGFTPYFIPLSLWVGAIMMFFVITDKVDDDINASPASVVAGKFISYGYIGIIQAILASAVVLTLGLKPKSLILYFLFNIFMAYVFIAIIQCLVFLLGMAGRLLSIAILILQLTSCAGTFPLEVVPKFFKVINPFMPFTYCVSAIREIIAGVNYATLSKDIAILAGTMFVFLGISMALKGHADKVKEIILEKKDESLTM
ncbi:YhgE/Pip domain-containing protein [Clostridium guangxiense]|uniref:YhgE/Pip domain-containing protein n=1 Tax=Clostridium guangxiense TaxID=1662055 RepID=UPI001E5DD014|nr:YhgE/Pip domain-containing protein [Clostridium guangxiense]MCD2346735.1 YhgE/Pip domain-containing protein [Clostridium guangxiense]